MPTYAYRCPNGHVGEEHRVSHTERNATGPCPTCHAPRERLYAYGVTTMVPRRFLTNWSDVHDRSEKELAKDPDVIRYDPTIRPPSLKPDLRPFFPKNESDIRVTPVAPLPQEAA